MTETEFESPNPSSGDFLSRLDRSGALTAGELAILREAGVQSSNALMALVRSFPSLAAHLRLRELSMAATADPRFAFTDDQLRDEEPVAEVSWAGVALPDDTIFQLGWSVPLPDIIASSAGHGGPSAGRAATNQMSRAVATKLASHLRKAIDLAPPKWHVRDQGKRGACVSFALTACREHQSKNQASPQFLYWATKKKSKDPHPDRDGTRLAFAREALGRHGVCHEPLWPYDPKVLAGNVAHDLPGAPDGVALRQALTQVRSSRFMRRSTANPNDEFARKILEWLHDRRRPVAISMPVFKDTLTQANNWQTLVGKEHGQVIDPPPTSIVGGGHAVCVTGFRPDEHEAMGGHFVFRNSWGFTSWGIRAVPQLGYGFLSARHVDRYCVEACQLDVD